MLVYIRAKTVRGEKYLYLVKSKWNSKKNASVQEIVKYLGKASKVSKEDLPPDYRNEPKIISFLAAYNPKNLKKKEESIIKSKETLYRKLVNGDVKGSLKIYEDYSKHFGISDFLDKVLKSVMYKIGNDWETNTISIASEHVASNTATSLVKILLERINVENHRKKILLCVPVGEEHHLGCDVIEAFLTTKGFKVFNFVNSAPAESILSFILDNKPDIVFVSITLKDNLKAGQRLVRKIKDQFDIPVFVGGFAFTTNNTPLFEAEILKDIPLEQIPKIIRGR